MLLRCVLFCVKGCLLGGGLFCATVRSKSRTDWEEGKKARGERWERESCVGAFFFLLIPARSSWSLRKRGSDETVCE